jgi:hypothetical protein
MATCLIVLACFWVTGMTLIVGALLRMARNTDDQMIPPTIED